MTDVRVIDNALVADRVTRLRDSSTPNHEFRRLLRDLSSILVYEAMRQAPLESVDVTTPMGPTVGHRLRRPPVVVPVLRAGLGMLDAALELLGDVEVAFVGLRRNEQTLEASQYASTLPASLEGRDALILDPMMATGGSCDPPLETLRAGGAG
ncbi:MAG: uracil phosphoribosyltransferase, partial [Acidimicrobiaceae bacterium]|nr:uracil phosphoribosyltransferase [Acidimicrobiaceae bacterium]